MTTPITMIELFGGIGAQERALRQLGIPYEITHYCDCDADATLSYAAMRWNLEKEMETFDFPSQEQMVTELQIKNLGYDFQKCKHKITMRTPIVKLKQYYIADKLSKNLGDISKVERLPYADFVTYSYPCTDLSVAGKGEGMVNKCDKCDCSWPINFENPKTNNICPNCGNIDIKSTRSGLLGQVQRLLIVAHEEKTLPKYLLLENVKNLTGKKFKPQFDAWLNWLDLIGYNTYYKVLNGKHYGVPQNRERVFAISIRKDVDINGYVFPESINLTTRLKDVLEKNVDDKYYLPDDRIEKILNSTFVQEKKRIQTTDVCDTLLARDWKDPKCVPIEDLEPVRIGGLYDGENGKHQAGAIWDKESISPTLDTMQGGNRQPFILEESQVELEPNTCLIQPKDRDYKSKNLPREVHIESKSDGVSHALRTNGETMVMEPFIVASRGRNPDNPSDRTTGAPTEQRLEPNFSGCTNCLTSVGKDNYVCEPQVLRAERTEYGKEIRKQYEAGEIDEKICNMREMKPRTDGVANTITTVLKDNYVMEPKEEKNLWTETQRKMITEDGNIKRYINSDVIDKFEVGDCADISFPNGYNKANRVFDGYVPSINGTTTQSSFVVKEPISIEPVIVEDFYQSREPRVYTETAPTIRSERIGLKAANGEIEYPCSTRGKQVASAIRASIYKQGSRNLEENVVNGLGYEGVIEQEEPKIRWRIRKLTAKECWRLMNFSDEDVDRASSYVSASSLYKQAGNSIIVACLIALMSSLFVEDGHKSEVWKKHMLNFND